MSRTATQIVLLSIMVLCVFGQLRMLQRGTGVVVTDVSEPVVVIEVPPPGTPWVFCPGAGDDPRPKHEIFWHREQAVHWPAVFRHAAQR